MAVLACTATTELVAASPSAPAREQGWHIVRPGDTLEGITVLYLGNREAWEENWKLNPEIADPHSLTPGQRLRVLVEPSDTRPSAQLRRVARKVEAKPDPIPWNRADVGDLLLARDGVRTFEQAAAEMRFNDGTSLLVGESSLVFLRDLGLSRAENVTGAVADSTTATPSATSVVDRQEIEIVTGQADLTAVPRASHQVEIVVNKARATTKSAGNSPTHSRARNAAKAAQFMVYSGAATVEAAAQQVEVGAGMGTAVPPTGPPGTPERLLPAPELLFPADGIRVAETSPELSWSPVLGAASYTLELCAEATCVELVERAVGLTNTSWRPANINFGDYHWRTFAISPSGLDGYASPPRQFTVANAPNTTNLPPATGAVRLAEPATFMRNGLPCVDHEAVKLIVEVSNQEGCGAAEWHPVIDGQRVDRAIWEGAWPAGDHRATVEVVDRCGNRGRLPEIALTVDADPPTFLWESRAPAPLELGMMPDPARDVVNRRTNWRKKGLTWLEWSPAGNLWLPFPTAADPPAVAEMTAANRARPQSRDDSSFANWELDPNRPWIFFAAPGGNLFAPSTGIELTPNNTLWLLARDAGCGVAKLVLRSLPPTTPEERGRVHIAASDHFSRTTVIELPLSLESRPLVPLVDKPVAPDPPLPAEPAAETP